MTLEAGKEMDRRCVMGWLSEVYRHPTVAFNTYSDEQQIEFAHDALVLLKEQEAVVRCKDCKHRENSKKCVLSAISEEKNFPLFMLDNRGEWFCADGEQKEQIWKKELVDDFEKHLHGNTDGILYHHYCIKCGWDWWSKKAFPNRCSKCDCELT